MQVNFPAVKQRFTDTGRTPARWARTKEIGPDLFRRWLNQRYVVAPGGEAEKRYMALLAEDGLLVLVEETEEPCPHGHCERALKDAGCAELETASGGRGEGEKVRKEIEKQAEDRRLKGKTDEA